MLLETNQPTKKTCEQKQKLINSIDRNQDSETQSTSGFDRELLVSWLFLIGSLIFTLDAVMEISKGITFSAVLHVSASILFTIGSVLFMPSDR
jgi:hypothetical protein